MLGKQLHALHAEAARRKEEDDRHLRQLASTEQRAEEATAALGMTS